MRKDCGIGIEGIAWAELSLGLGAQGTHGPARVDTTQNRSSVQPLDPTRGLGRRPPSGFLLSLFLAALLAGCVQHISPHSSLGERKLLSYDNGP